jgi:hypothetical protein
LLSAIACNSTNNRILRSSETISGTLCVALGFSGGNLSFSSGVFFFAGLLEGFHPSHVADGFDGCAFDGVELTGGLPVTGDCINMEKREERETTYEGLPDAVLSEEGFAPEREDMMMMIDVFKVR